jgi:hypothetical protein
MGRCEVDRGDYVPGRTSRCVSVTYDGTRDGADETAAATVLDHARLTRTTRRDAAHTGTVRDLLKRGDGGRDAAAA